MPQLRPDVAKKERKKEKRNTNTLKTSYPQTSLDLNTHSRHLFGDKVKWYFADFTWKLKHFAYSAKINTIGTLKNRSRKKQTY